MQAIILAAGLGNRLRPLTERTPKCLVEVNGTPVIVRALDALSELPVERAIIVLGHLGNQVRARLGTSWKGVEIVYVENPDYAGTNNVYSLWLAREHFDRESILMECDIFFEPALITTLLARRGDNVAIVDRFKPFMDGTAVELDGEGNLSRMIPARDQSDTFTFADKWKTVNVYFFTQAFLSDVFAPNLDWYVRTHRHDQYYELILTVLIYMGQHKIRAALAGDTKWMEIDDHADLARAEVLFSDRPALFERIDRLHGGYWRYDVVDFAYLYNLYFPPTPLVNELKANLPSLIGQYPSAQRELAALAANWTMLDPEYLAVANGASEIISILKRDVVRRITIPVPTFNEYETGLSPDQIEYVPCSEQDGSLDLETYATAVERSGSNVALLINPNNPTARFIEPDKVEALLERLRPIEMVVLDESFIEFATPDTGASMASRLARYPNLVIVKSLSKNLGIPGLRLGYAASANAAFIARLRAGLSIWNINALAEYFLEVVTKYRGDYVASCAKTREARDVFHAQLLTVPGITPFKPQANFVLVRLDERIDSGTLKKGLFLDANILIKDCSNKTGLRRGRFVRIAVRRPEENALFVRALREVLAKP